MLIQSDSLEGARPFAQGCLEVFRVRSLKLLNQIQTAKPLEYAAPYMKWYQANDRLFGRVLIKFEFRLFENQFRGRNKWLTEIRKTMCEYKQLRIISVGYIVTMAWHEGLTMCQPCSVNWTISKRVQLFSAREKKGTMKGGVYGTRAHERGMLRTPMDTDIGLDTTCSEY